MNGSELPVTGVGVEVVCDVCVGGVNGAWGVLGIIVRLDEEWDGWGWLLCTCVGVGGVGGVNGPYCVCAGLVMVASS